MAEYYEKHGGGDHHQTQCTFCAGWIAQFRGEMLFRNSAFATKTLTSIVGFPSTMGQYVVDCTNSIEEYRENIIETNLVHYRYFLCAIVLWIPSLQ